MSNDQKKLIRLQSISLDKDEHRKPLQELYLKTGKRIWCIVPPSQEVFLQESTVDPYGIESGRSYFRFSKTNFVIYLTVEESRQLISWGACDVHEIVNLFQIDEDLNIRRKTIKEVVLLVNPINKIFERDSNIGRFSANPFIRMHSKKHKFVGGLSTNFKGDCLLKKDMEAVSLTVSLDHVLIERSDLDIYIKELQKADPEYIRPSTIRWMGLGIRILNKIAEVVTLDVKNGKKHDSDSIKSEIKTYYQKNAGLEPFSPQKLSDIVKIIYDDETVFARGFLRLYSSDLTMTLLDIVNFLARFDYESQTFIQCRSSSRNLSGDPRGQLQRFENEKIEYSKDRLLPYSVNNSRMLVELAKKSKCIYFPKRSRNAHNHAKWIEDELESLGYKSVWHLSKTISQLIRIKENK